MQGEGVDADTLVVECGERGWVRGAVDGWVRRYLH